jgi:alpha-amylase
MMRFIIYLFPLFLLPALQAQTVSITFEVNMSWEIEQGRFNILTETVDVAGSFNGWGSTGHRLSDTDRDSIYSVTVTGFTPGTTIQFKFRQNGLWDGSEEFPGGGPNRSYLVPSANSTYSRWYSDRTPATTALVAGFGTSSTHIRPGGSVRFTDASAGRPSTYAWSFPGGTPATSSQRDPSVTYAEAGLYDVRLIVSGSGRIDTLIAPKHILVSESAPLPSSGPIVRDWREDLFYEIYVRSFQDSDGDGVGDFRGLTARLPYLEELGITGIWLMPIHPSPSDHGYDVTDYRGVNPQYGTKADFEQFLAAAQSRGIKVILDYVMNHSSSQHPWFVQSAANNPTYRNFYRWSTTNPGITGPWGQQVWHSRNSAFYYGIFTSGMPDINYDHAPAKDSIFAAARYWLQDVGVDGFRLDAVLYLDEDGNTLSNTPGTFQLLQEFKTATASANPNSFLVGEAWTQSSTVRNYVINNRLDYAFEFDLATRMLDAVNSRSSTALVNHLNYIKTLYGAGKWGSFLTNHDQDRVFDVLGGDAAKLKTAAGLLLSVPGVPYLYYGEEVGSSGTKPDPNIRRQINWTVVDAQRADSTSLWSTYRKHIAIRQQDTFWWEADYTALAAGALLTQIYADADLTSSGIVFTNLGTSAVSASTTGLSGVLTGATLAVERVTGDTLRLPTLQALQQTVIPAGQTRIWSVSYATGTSIESGDSQRGTGIKLHPAYPNPFNPSTVIGFTVETQDLASPHMSLAIYDILGREVAVLVDGAMPTGSHSVTFDASGLASGVYLVRLEADGMVRTRSISLIK